MNKQSEMYIQQPCKTRRNGPEWGARFLQARLRLQFVHGHQKGVYLQLGQFSQRIFRQFEVL